MSVWLEMLQRINTHQILKGLTNSAEHLLDMS